MKPVKMYTTQVCPYCVRAKTLLQQRGVPVIEEIRVDLAPAERDRMIEPCRRFSSVKPMWAAAMT